MSMRYISGRRSPDNGIPPGYKPGLVLDSVYMGKGEYLKRWVTYEQLVHNREARAESAQRAKEQNRDHDLGRRK